MTRRNLTIAAISVVLSLSACDGAVDMATSNAVAPTSSPVGAVAPPDVTPETTSQATPEATAEPAGVGEVSAAHVISWEEEFLDSISANVVATIENTGTGWIEVRAFDSSYTVLSKTGDTLTAGSFSYAYPRFLAPGQIGYLAEDIYLDDSVKREDLGAVEVDGQYLEVEESEAVVIDVSKVKNRKDSFTGGWATTGRVTNKSDNDLESAHVGAFYLDDKGKVLGFSSTNLVENLDAGESKGFETVTTSAPIKQSAIKKTVVFASSSDF